MKKTFRIWIYSLLVIGVSLMFSSSCEKSEDTNNQISNETVKDIDGNIYHIVTIGTQVWMVENLKTTKYRNGDLIPNVTSNGAWAALKTGAYCHYNNDAAFGTKYGNLYNWYVVNDSRNIAPIGWHVPTDGEWLALDDYLSTKLGNIDGEGVGKALAAKTDWANSKNTGDIGNDLTKNNSTGFSALPGGSRYKDGGFYKIGEFTGWWSSTADNMYPTSRAMGVSLEYDNNGDFGDGNYYGIPDQKDGLSIRCIKD